MKFVPKSDPVLWTPCATVTDVATQVLPLLPEMFHLLARTKNAFGFSAPQVGIPLRFFIFQGQIKRKGIFLPRTIVVNPVITWRSEDLRKDSEGCLSDPGVFIEKARAESIRVNFQDETDHVTTGKLVSGFVARVFQHECDHLDGINIFSRPTETVQPNS